MKSRLAPLFILAFTIAVGSSASSLSPIVGPRASFIVGPPPASLRVFAIGDGVGFGFGSAAADFVFSSADLPGAITRSNNAAAFNAMTPAQLRASYDIIMFTWFGDPSVNADWNTRILPFLNLGGGVIFEDFANIGDLSPAVIGGEVESAGGYAITTSVPGLTDGIVPNFANHHLGLFSWDPRFTQFLTEDDGTGSGSSTGGGIAGQFGGGRIVVTGPDNDYHGVRGAGLPLGNNYNLLLNELRWVAPFAYNVAKLKQDVLALVGGGLTASQAATLNQILDLAQMRFNNGQGGGAASLLRSFNAYVNRYPLSGPSKALLLGETSDMIVKAVNLPAISGP